MKPARTLIALVVCPLALCLLGFCNPAQGQTVKLDGAWFKPTLTENQDPACDVLLADAVKIFRSTSQWTTHKGTVDEFMGLKRTPGVFDPADRNGSSVQLVPDAPGVLLATQPDGRKLFLHRVSNNGCGGACETESIAVGEQPLPNDRTRETWPASTPQARTWSIFEAVRGGQFLIGVVDDALHVYRVAAPAEWRLSCRIALAPRFPDETHASIQAAQQSVEALITAAGALAGGEGNCGSSHTLYRWSGYRKAALQQALYRPWASKSPAADWHSENSYGDYARIENNLRDWSTRGLAERAAFERYSAQLAQTTKILGDFLESQYGLTKAEATAMARDALTTGVSLGFGFYGPDPDAVRLLAPLRQRVLDHRPMSEVTQAWVQVEGVNTPGTESPLNSAVAYPEALEFLLSKGVDPNVANGFGKTPLMYAAQYNQPQSVDLLLAHGADPNAATVWPEDDCYYTLTTSGMTALHYAVRYGSADTVRRLLKGGAATFARAEAQSYGRQDTSGYPVDWLHHFVGQGAAEPNPNLSAEDAITLEPLLIVPDQTAREALAADLTSRAEADYAAGKIDAASLKLKQALQAHADQPRALSDLSLVALKAGNVERSLEASARVLATSSTASTLASAWFNTGLACAQAPQRFVNYNGKYYCRDSPLFPFVKAWQTEHSKARANRLAAVLQQPEIASCTGYHVTRGDGDRKAFGGRLVVYAYHPSEKQIDTKSVHCPVGGNLEDSAVRLIRREDLGSGAALTILASNCQMPELSIQGLKCPVR